MARTEGRSHNLHKTFLTQTQEYLTKQADVKADPTKLTADLKDFNELNRWYKWLELHKMNIETKWYEGKADLSPLKHNFADTLQVKNQDVDAVSREQLKLLKYDMISQQSLNKQKIEMQNFNYQGAKK